MPKNQTTTGPDANADQVGKPTVPDGETLKADANALRREVEDVAGKVTAEAKDQVGQLADQAKAEVDKATQKVKGIAAEQKDFLAAQIGGVADAMERVAADLEASNGSSAHYARIIADNAEKLSDTVRDKDVEQILGMAEDFGRRQPAAFIGAAALLGFAASRFLLASRKRAEEQAVAVETEEEPYLPGAAPTGSGTTSTYTYGRP